MFEKTKIIKKEAGVGPFFYNNGSWVSAVECDLALPTYFQMCVLQLDISELLVKIESNFSKLF